MVSRTDRLSGSVSRSWMSAPSWSGTSGSGGRCRGGRRATRTRCSSPEVMLQQTQAPRVGRTTSASWIASPIGGALAAAPAREVLALWRGWVTTGGRGRSRSGAGGRRAGGRLTCRSCPASARTRRPRSARSPWTASSRPSTRTSSACSLARRGRHTPPAPPRGPRAAARGPRRDFNQAMMEFGAIVWRPRAPRCALCPVAAGCGGPLPGALLVVARGSLRGHRPLGSRADRRGAAGWPAVSRWKASGASARWPGSSVTGWSFAGPTDSAYLP